MKILILHSSVLKLYHFLIALVLISKISLCNENKQILFSNELIGKQIDTKTFKLQNGMKYTSFRVDGGFKTSINKYGTYECSVNIINNQNNKLVKSDYICEFKDQDKLRFWSIGKRLEG